MTAPQTKTRGQYFSELANPPEARYRRDPVGWATERAGLELWSKQKEILTSIVDHRNTAVKSCHSAGKSFISAVATCWWLDAHPPGEARVITTAPTSKQVDAVLWYEINKLHAKLGLRGQCNLREWYLGKQLVALGRKPPDYQQAAFQGLHAKHLLVIYDEAYGIPTSLWNEGSSLASNEYARQLAIGNPDGPGDFQDNCDPESGWNVIHISYRHAPNFTGEFVSPNLADMLIHPDWVEERRRRWGEHSALFASKCEGDFPDVGGDPWQVIPNGWVQQCRYLEYPAGKKPIEAGVDVGGGNDRTVVTVREGNRVKDIKWFVDPDPMQTVARVASFLKEHGVTYLETASLADAMKDADVIYQTRIQKERLSKEAYERTRGHYVIDRTLADSMKEKAIIIHPLPRVGEITPEVDESPHAVYFRQVGYGVMIRMAILSLIFEKSSV